MVVIERGCRWAVCRKVRVVKFAWSQPAAGRVAHEIGVLAALADEPGFPFLPEVVASSHDPLLMVTRLVPGAALFDVVNSIDREDAGRQLARFLAILHRRATRARVEAAIGELPAALLPASTTTLRDRLGKWIRPDQRRTVMRWCEWADEILAPPHPAVLVHGDNQVWDHGELRLVVDFETVTAADPEYDLRTFPGTGPGVELLDATMRHYHRISGRKLCVDRVMAWHLRTKLSDALWRSEAHPTAGPPDTSRLGRGPLYAIPRARLRSRNTFRDQLSISDDIVILCRAGRPKSLRVVLR